MTSILNPTPEYEVGAIFDYHPNSSDVTTLTDGSYVVIWSTSNVYSNGIVARHFNADGSPRGAAVNIFDQENLETLPSVTTLADGRYALTYVSATTATNQALRTLVFNAADEQSGGGVLYSYYADQTASTTTLSGGAATLVNVRTANNSTAAGMYLATLNSNGSWYGSARVDTLGNTPIDPTVAGLDNGQIVAAWAGIGSDGFYNIYTRIFAADRTPLAVESILMPSGGVNRTALVIVAMPTGGYVITWQEGSGASAAVHAQLVGDDGGLIGDSILVSAAAGSQESPDIAILSDGGFAIVWTNGDSDGTGLNIRSQRFDADGHKVGPEQHVNTIDVAGEQSHARIAGLEDGGYVVTWNDLGNGDYGQLYSRTYHYADTLVGNQILYGTGDADILDGGSGSDAMYGGYGDDTYVANTAGDKIWEDPDGGNDTVQTYVNYTLGEGLENLMLMGLSPLTGTGNAADNTLIGNAGGNALSGGAGDDYIEGQGGNDIIQAGNGNDLAYGGNGDDTFISSTGADKVYGDAGDDTYSAAGLETAATLNLVTGIANQGGYKTHFYCIENLTGSLGNDVLTGDSLENVLNGGGGADSMAGSLGDDTYYVDDASDIVTESSNASGGDDVVFASVSYTLTGYVEDLVLTGSAITGNGNALDNTITGNRLDNLIDGKAGADTMIGGLGNDTYWVDVASDVVTELAGQGTDTVRAGLSYALGANLENLILTGTGNFNATGNSGANGLTGNAGNNVLDGQTGADTMIGGQGNDTYYVDDTGDVVTEADTEGTDIIYSTVTYSLSGRFVETLALTGGANINATGNTKANTLIGNTGNNSFTGGNGADIFLFNTSSGADTITDFTTADTINVSAYHAVSHTVTQSGGNVVINFGSGNTITVVAATVADVNAHTIF